MTNERTTELTSKQRAFVEHYLACWNATEAAKLAGYSKKSAYSIGSENLRKPEIAEAIAARIAELKLAADEVLLRLADQARGSLGDFLFIGEEDVVIKSTIIERNEDEDDDADSPNEVEIVRNRPRIKAKPSTMILQTETVKRPTVHINLEQAKQHGKLHLLKKVKEGQYGLEIELHDPQAALIKLGEHLQLFGKQDDILKYVDLSKLSNDQLTRLANGENLYRVLLQQ